MANMQKYTRSQIGGLSRHYERAKKEDGTYYEFGNQEIDTGKTHLNYNLAPERDGGQLGFIKQRTTEVQCLKREDVNVMCSWVITAPKDLEENECNLFFREAYRFLNERYAGGSDKNVISAYVHMDEVSPHLHYAFVPVVHDKKKGIDKVSAKIAVDRLDLQTFHSDLERHMSKVFGREVGILNEATKEGNKSIDELKRGTAQEKVRELESQKTQIAENVSELRSMALEAKSVVNDLEEKRRALEGKIEALESKFKTVKGERLERDKILAIKPVANVPLSKDKAIYYTQDIDNLKATASQRAEVDEETKQTQAENKRLKARVNSLLGDKKQLEQDLAISQKQAKSTMDERMETARLKSQLQYIPKADLERFIAQYRPQRSQPQKERGYEPGR